MSSAERDVIMSAPLLVVQSIDKLNIWSFVSGLKNILEPFVFFSAAMCEMMKIMQENREVTCCLGSSANFRNSRLFLQSDLRYRDCIDSQHLETFFTMFFKLKIYRSFPSHLQKSLNLMVLLQHVLSLGSTVLGWTLCIHLSVHGRPLAMPQEEDLMESLKESLLWDCLDSWTAWAAPSPSTRETALAWLNS